MRLKFLLTIMAATLLLTSSLSSCSWIWRKSNQLGDMMPVYDKSRRCDSNVYCTTKDYQERNIQQQNPMQNLPPEQMQTPQPPQSYNNYMMQPNQQQMQPDNNISQQIPNNGMNPGQYHSSYGQSGYGYNNQYSSASPF